MTAETRKRLAEHFRSIGQFDHPYCAEFPAEEEQTEEPKPELKIKKRGRKKK